MAPDILERRSAVVRIVGKIYISAPPGSEGNSYVSPPNAYFTLFVLLGSIKRSSVIPIPP
jgi:hypothetical protein